MTSPERKRRVASISPSVALGAGNVCTLLFALLLLAIYFRPFADLDFTWQIRTGEQIVHNRSLHVADQLTYTIAGRSLPDFEWLYEVALWAVWSVAGAPWPKARCSGPESAKVKKIAIMPPANCTKKSSDSPG